MKTSTKSSGLATAGMILGIIAVVLSAIPIINNFAILLAVLALIFAVVTLVQTKKGKYRSDYKVPTAIILGVVSIIIVFASQAYYSSLLHQASNDIDSAITEFEEDSNKASGDATEELLANDLSVELGTFSATEDEYGLVTTELPVSITNKNAEKKTYSIQIEAVDANGTRITDDTIYTNDLGASQSQSFKAFQYVSSENLEAVKTATFKIVSASQY